MAWTKVSTVEEYVVDGDRVTFHCTTESDGERLTDIPWTVPVSVDFFTPDTFRFEVQANPEGRRGYPRTDDARSHYPELDPGAISEPVELSVTETDGRVVVSTGALELTVGLDPWRLTVETADGDLLFEEERDIYDVRGNERIHALGFETEEINNGPHRVTRTGTAFRFDTSEKIYGLGEQFTGFDRRGRSFDLWHVEPLGTETERAYKNIPFHLSTSGYGMLVDTTSRVRYDLGDTTTASGSITVAEDRFSCIFFCCDSFKAIIEAYTGLTGRPDRPPKWSFGTWMSRLGYESREELERITDRLRAEEIPADVVHLDPFWMRENHSCDLTWDREQFPDPEDMIEGLHDNDFRLSLWEHPHVPVGTAAFETGVDEGYFIDTPAGKPYIMDRTCQGDYRGAIVDFTDPEAVAWWQDKHRDLLAMGVDVFKTDYGEYVPEDAVFDNGRSGAAMHNLYPYLYNEAVYDAIRAEHGEDGLVWARSAWVGSQKFPVHWGGDPHPSQSGMAAALRGGLSASLSGIAFWSHDIGGFRGTPSPELYVRWAQFGLLSSHARCHGTTPREPWVFGEEATDTFREYAELRYSLLPYIYTYAEVAARTGLPVVRPLVLEYEDDPRAQQLDTQYLLGEDLLVVPVFYETGRRSVYLPEGGWRAFGSTERHEGGRTLDVPVDLGDLPLFVRAGSVVPRREPTQSVRAGTPEELTFEATLADEDGGDGEAATGRYYDEDAEEMVAVRAELQDGLLDVAVGPTSAERVTAVAYPDADAAPLDGVTLDGESLERVEADPAVGQWTVRDDGAVLARR